MCGVQVYAGDLKKVRFNLCFSNLEHYGKMLFVLSAELYIPLLSFRSQCFVYDRWTVMADIALTPVHFEAHER